MEKTVVVLGAGPAGVPTAHWLLKHTARKFPHLKVILVSPNTDFFWNFATPRAILPNLIPENDIFVPLQPLFAHYTSDQFEYVLGTAEQLDPMTNTLVVSSNKQRRSIRYDTLVIATGAAAQQNMPFKNLSSSEETKVAIHSLRDRIEAASSIIVGGAGPTGVEVAGELGHAYSLTGKKSVTLVCSKELPLDDNIRHNIRELVKSELEKLKVKVIPDSRIKSVTETDENLRVETVSGTEQQALIADLFIPTYGTIPNTSFMPKSMLDSNSFAKQNLYLQAEDHENIFVVGDVGNLQPAQGKYVEEQLIVLVKNLDAQITGTGELTLYKPDNRLFLGVSIGPTSGTAQYGDWKIWTFVVRWMKSRTLGTEFARPIAAGERTRLQRNW